MITLPPKRYTGAANWSPSVMIFFAQLFAEIVISENDARMVQRVLRSQPGDAIAYNNNEMPDMANVALTIEALRREQMWDEEENTDVRTVSDL